MSVRASVVLPLLLALPGLAQPAEKPLVDFADAGLAARLKVQGAPDVTTEIVDGPQGKALKVSCAPGKEGYPGVAILPEQAAFDLSAFGCVKADFTNLSNEQLTLAVRVDNAGDWQTNPWNSENLYLPAGKSGSVTVTFGWSWGNAGFALNPAKVTQLLIFTTKPKQPISFRLDSLRGAGKPGQKPPGVIDHVKPAGGALVSQPATVAPGTKGTAFACPDDQLWNLADYNQVDFALRNPGDKPVKVTCRVDNKWATAKNNSVLAEATLPAGATQTVSVPFGAGGPWDGNVKGSGAQFGSDVVAGVWVAAEAAVELLGAKAVVAPPPAMPTWLGTRPPVPGQWTKTFEDNFEGQDVDPTRWTLPEKEQVSIWDKGATEVAANTYLEHGVMQLKCEKRAAPSPDPKFKNCKYVTSVVTTFDKFAQKYGYFEARMKLPTVLGMWPAFWMMPDRGKDAGIWWKRQDTHNGGMEIDIMEWLTRFGQFRYNIATHWDGYDKDHKSTGTERIYYQADKDGFITSGLLWEPGKLTWYCQGQVVAEWKNDRVPTVPGYLMFTLPTGGWGTNGFVEDAKLPDTFTVDWVRCWQNADWAKP